MIKNVSKIQSITSFLVILAIFEVTPAPLWGKAFMGTGVVPCSYVSVENNKQEIALLMRFSESKELWEPFIMEKDRYKRKMVEKFWWLKNKNIYDHSPFDTALRMRLSLPCEYQTNIEYLLKKSHKNGWFKCQHVDCLKNMLMLTFFFVPVSFVSVKNLSSYVDTVGYEWVLLKDLVQGALDAKTAILSVDRHEICIEVKSLVLIRDAFREGVFTGLEKKLKDQTTESRKYKHIKNPFDITQLIDEKKKRNSLQIPSGLLNIQH